MSPLRGSADVDHIKAEKVADEHGDDGRRSLRADNRQLTTESDTRHPIPNAGRQCAPTATAANATVSYASTSVAFFACLLATSRVEWSRIFLRMRMDWGVTSTSSSSSIHSRHCSRVISRAGVSWTAKSLPEARMLVRCFLQQTCTTMSASREFSPTTMPP